jgi:serine/threonine protein kinase
MARCRGPRALNIGAQISRSLREAHKLGLVHRDLKPANIMLLSEGTGGDVVKVLDFGLVKSFLPEAPRSAGAPSSNPEITQAGVLLGSPLYMAPEQARNEADQRTDIYALGTLLFQCISGRPPFVGTESIDLIVKHLREAPPQLNSLVAEVPLAVNALVMKCLEKSPEARFQHMDELLEAMHLATKGQGMSSVFADPRLPSKPALTPTGTRLAEKATLTGDSVEIELALTGERPARSRMPVYVGVTAVIVVVCRPRRPRWGCTTSLSARWW